MLRVSVGVPVYNEEANINSFLETLLGQRLKKVKIKEIIFVASGCTDKTVEIIKNFQKKEKKIKLFIQPKRIGKTSADNLFFQKAKSKILVLTVADILLKEDCLEKLVLPLARPEIGITAARIIPLNDKSSFTGYFSHLWWRLWHLVALDFFRGGEIIAFRAVVSKIPLKIGADEIFLTNNILNLGYKAKYLPEAVVYNMSPQTLTDIVRTRRRHNCLHLQFLRLKPKGYYPKTMDIFYIFYLFLKEINWFSFKEILWSFSCGILELVSRCLALYDFHIGKKEYRIWSISESTKKLLILQK